MGVQVETPKIFGAISAVMGEIDAVGKNKKNAQQGYSYRGIDDVYLAVNAAMVKHGVFTVPKVLDMKREEKPSRNGGTLFTTVLTMEYTFYAVDGSHVQVVVIGEGMDSGDKASNKAMSVAQKYAFIQIFSIPTEDPKDPEIDSPEPRFVPKQTQSPGAGDSPTPEKAVTSTASTPSCASPGEFVTPFGREKKGKRIDELTHDEIKKGIAYCQAEGKNQEWVKNALAYLNGLTTGMTLDDSTEFVRYKHDIEHYGVEMLGTLETEIKKQAIDKKLSDSEVDRLFALIDGKKK